MCVLKVEELIQQAVTLPRINDPGPCLREPIIYVLRKPKAIIVNQMKQSARRPPRAAKWRSAICMFWRARLFPYRSHRARSLFYSSGHNVSAFKGVWNATVVSRA